jgi:uncharacterized protein YlxP (DUF503 family)
MIVGCARVSLALHGVGSLKEKRSIVKTVLHRATTKFHVAGAETDDLDYPQSAELGFAMVGNDRRVINSALDKLLDYLDGLGLAEVVGEEIEILNL